MHRIHSLVSLIPLLLLPYDSIASSSNDEIKMIAYARIAYDSGVTLTAMSSAYLLGATGGIPYLRNFTIPASAMSASFGLAHAAVAAGSIAFVVDGNYQAAADLSFDADEALSFGEDVTSISGSVVAVSSLIAGGNLDQSIANASWANAISKYAISILDLSAAANSFAQSQSFIASLDMIKSSFEHLSTILQIGENATQKSVPKLSVEGLKKIEDTIAKIDERVQNRIDNLEKKDDSVVDEINKIIEMKPSVRPSQGGGPFCGPKQGYCPRYPGDRTNQDLIYMQIN